MLTGEHWKSVSFKKVDNSKDKCVNLLDFYANLDRVEGFHQIGTERIGELVCDIWEGEFNKKNGESLYKYKLQVWLSPRIGELGRVKSWTSCDGEEYVQTGVLYLNLTGQLA